MSAERPGRIARRVQASRGGRGDRLADLERAVDRRRRALCQGRDFRAQSNGSTAERVGGSVARAGVGARGRALAGGSRAAARQAQELGLSATGVVGAVGRRGAVGVASGFAVGGCGPAVDAVARGQPGRGAERGPTRFADDARTPGRGRSAARRLAGTGGICVGVAASSVAAARRRTDPRSSLEPGRQSSGPAVEPAARSARPHRDLAATSRTGRVETRRSPASDAQLPTTDARGAMRRHADRGSLAARTPDRGRIMTEATRHEIIRRHQGGASIRQIAADLHLARQTVQAAIRRWESERTDASPAPATRRPSALDAYDDAIRQWLTRYPDITVTRLLEELRRLGFTGRYTILRERVRELRPRPSREPVVRFETDPGAQAQMDYSTYDLDFTGSGRRRVHLFSYLLSYSRRQYLRFVEVQDLPTTLREHIRAFEHLGGIARTCLYDNMKVVVLRHGDEGPLYNPKFLAFATHYGFTPWACRVRRSQTKGKVERHFSYVESNLLNRRTFASLDHLN